MPQEQPFSPSDTFTVSYRLKPPAGVAPEQFAQDIAEEQTVEIPHVHIPRELISTGIVGRVLDIREESDGVFSAAVTYRNDVSAFSAPQLLNVLFGNISLKKGIKITGLSFSEKMLALFRGPLFGIEGVRAQVGVYGRPLLCTALKPMGLSGAELAGIAEACARGGVDLIKDDHGIGDQPFCRFEERIPRVAEAIAAADAATGNTTLYFPNLCGSREEIERQAELAVRNGIRAVLCAPQLVGFDVPKWLADTFHLMVMAHPAFTGALFTSEHEGFNPDLFLGTLFRMLGADISIFPSWGGRFPFTRSECTSIADALTRSMPPLRSTLPAPAGGITLEHIGAIADAYGSESALLVGGALLGPSHDLSGSVKKFLGVLSEHFTEERKEPAFQFGSSCELPASPERRQQQETLLSCDEYQWCGRAAEAYKPDGEAVFKHITRTELIGRSGTGTAFDLRYFEIGPDGYSSMEKHLHEHVIIGVRGNGILLKGGRRYSIRPNDIAYVGKRETHQLLNEEREPFGFFCIVDHERDRPVPVSENS